MLYILCFALGGTLAGIAIARLRGERWLRNRALYAGIGSAGALCAALLGHLNSPELHASIDRNAWVAGGFFFAITGAFAYLFFWSVSLGLPEQTRARLLRYADIAGALATAAIVVALLAWNLTLAA